MGVISTNKSLYFGTPSASSVNFNHTTSSGNFKTTTVIVYSTAVSVSSVQYQGRNLTLKRQENTSYGVFWSVWELTGVATGTNQPITVTFASGQFNTTSIVALSFTGSNGIRTTSFNNTQASNQTTDITILANSLIVGSVIAENSTGAYIEIPQGTNITPLGWNHATFNPHFGAVSSVLTAGTKTVKGGASAANIILAIEMESKNLTRRIINF